MFWLRLKMWAVFCGSSRLARLKNFRADPEKLERVTTGLVVGLRFTDTQSFKLKPIATSEVSFVENGVTIHCITAHQGYTSNTIHINYTS